MLYNLLAHISANELGEAPHVYVGAFFIQFMESVNDRILQSISDYYLNMREIYHFCA